MATALSIVTVVKDDPSGLQQTLNSLARCDPTDLDHIEWIIIDGSLDAGALRNLVADSPVPAAVHWVPPEGVYQAMNTGLSLATGEYVYFLNAGDYLREGQALTTILSILARSQPTWLYGQVAFADPNGSKVVPPRFDYEVERKSSFSRGRFPPHQGTIVRRDSLLSIGGFDTSYRVTADYTAMLRLSLLNDPLEITDVIAEFTTGGLSESRWLLAINEFHRARLEVLRPRGWDLAAEFVNTANQALRMTLTRVLKGRSGRRLP